VAKERPPVPVIAITPDRAVLGRLALLWGVVPLQARLGRTTDAMIEAGEAAVLRAGLLPRGAEVVVVAGTTGLRGATNMVRLARLGR
jgi:pyruvate kinase